MPFGHQKANPFTPLLIFNNSHIEEIRSKLLEMLVKVFFSQYMGICGIKGHLFLHVVENNRLIVAYII